MHHCTANPPSLAPPPTPQSSTPVLVPVLQNWRGPAPPIHQLPFFSRSQTRSVFFFSDKPNEVDTSSRKRLLTGHSQSVADIDLKHHPNPSHSRRLPLGRSPSDRLGRIDPTTAAGSRSQNHPRPTRPNASGVSLFSSPIHLPSLQVGTLLGDVCNGSGNLPTRLAAPDRKSSTCCWNIAQLAPARSLI